MNKRIYVAGHRGMVGSALCRQLETQGHVIITRTSAEVDLTNQVAVQDFFRKENVDEVYLAAAKVGGIHANNTYPAEFIYQNLMIEANVIHQAYVAGVKRLLFLGSSCIYPRLSNQPIIESELLTGKLEPTNEPYAIAKIAGIKLCESYNRQYTREGIDYRSVMPTNLYGPGDNYHEQNSHVMPALIQRFHNAKINGDSKVMIWGTGTPRREFLHVDDMAAASIFVMNLASENYSKNAPMNQSHINVGTGEDVSIGELASIVKDVVGYQGEIGFDTSKPDGAPRKLMDVSLLTKLGWKYSVPLVEGVRSTYQNFIRTKLV